MTKKFHLKLNNRIFKVEVESTESQAIEVGEDVHNALAEQLDENHEDSTIIFFEELLVVCNKCGKELDEDEESEARCSQCQALFCCECDTELSEKERDKDNYMCDKCEAELE